MHTAFKSENNTNIILRHAIPKCCQDQREHLFFVFLSTFLWCIFAHDKQSRLDFFYFLRSAGVSLALCCGTAAHAELYLEWLSSHSSKTKYWCDCESMKTTIIIAKLCETRANVSSQKAFLKSSPVRKPSWQCEHIWLNATKRLKCSLWRVCGALGFAWMRDVLPVCVQSERNGFLHGCREFSVWEHLLKWSSITFLMPVLSALAFTVHEINKWTISTGSEIAGVFFVFL